MYTRMLVNVDNGGAMEVYTVMRNAPVSWGPILILDNIQDTSTLFTKVTEHQKALLAAPRSNNGGGEVITSDNIHKYLTSSGYNGQSSSSSRTRTPYRRQANHNEAEADSDSLTEIDPIGPQAEELTPIGEGAMVLSQAYAVLQRRQRPPPKDGYPFPKNDHVKTKMSRLPPSPCKVCGSDNHWDKECPDYDVYNERSRRSAQFASMTEDKSERTYSSAYSVMVLERLQGFELAAQHEEAKEDTPLVDSSSARKSYAPSSPGESDSTEKLTSLGNIVTVYSVHRVQKVTIEEVEDEDEKAYRSSPKALLHLLEVNEDYHEAMKVDRDSVSTDPVDGPSGEPLPPYLELPKPPAPDGRPIRMFRRRQTPAGTSAVGVSVLSAKGWIGSIRNPVTDLRMDSCADVTLISKEFYDSLKYKPAVKQGLRMRLWQLTDSSSKIEGFVRIPAIMMDTNGVLVEAEAEAYVVPNMSIPILLGEDFQLNYEIGVTRNVEDGTFLRFGKSDHVIAAQGVERTYDFDRLRQSAFMVESFVKSKMHRRQQAKRHRRKVKFGTETKLVRSKEDYRIRPHECKIITVEGQFETDKEWLVEKTLLANTNDSYFAVPNVLISAKDPRIPISNPTDQPRFIRRGEIIGTLVDPNKHFDSPGTKERLAEMERFANLYEKLIVINNDLNKSHPKPSTEQPAPTESREEVPVDEDEEIGPKTAAFPDSTFYPSDKLEELIDVGALPDELKEDAWNMLRKNLDAFGFDGRLGNHPAKVHIRTADGQVPISLPMYGSSPAKREVIDKQLDLWFSQGVIEPSKSPWGAPVVIAYRNGKARFCVDYRKLNAVTVPDEFPIPRQSEILSSLAGSQVMSSLDALSGFTQLELDEEDIEKTAFRTH